MSGPCPTIDSLIALGFEPRETQSGLDQFCYRFPNLDLVAGHVMNRYARYVVLLTGVIETARTLAIIETQIPPDLGSASEAAAWVSYALKSHRSQLEPLPGWFVQGERHWDLVLPAQMEREAREKQQAYEACPKCYIDRDYARPLRHNLLEEFSWLAGATEMTFKFDGRVLSMDLGGRVHEVIASGDSWPSSYQVIVSPETTLPARFTSPTVVVSVFEGCVSLGGLRVGPCEAVA